MVFTTLWTIRNDMCRTLLAGLLWIFIQSAFQHRPSYSLLPFCLSSPSSWKPCFLSRPLGTSWRGSRVEWLVQELLVLGGSWHVHPSSASITSNWAGTWYLLPFFNGDTHLALPSLLRHQFSKELLDTQCFWDVTASFWCGWNSQLGWKATGKRAGTSMNCKCTHFTCIIPLEASMRCRNFTCLITKTFKNMWLISPFRDHLQRFPPFALSGAFKSWRVICTGEFLKLKTLCKQGYNQCSPDGAAYERWGCRRPL